MLAIAIAASKDGKQITQSLFEGKIGWVDWQRPGFDLGLKLKACLDDNPGIKGIMLGSHGLFTWGDTAFECYINTLEVIEKCAAYVHEKGIIQKNVFGGIKVKSLPEIERKKKAALLAPVLRGLCSSHQKMIGHFTDDERVLEFVNSNDLDRLATMGTSCPDHFLRTKISPLVLNLTPQEDLGNINEVKQKITPLFDGYRNMYAEYYNTCKHPNSPALRDPNPVVILYHWCRNVHFCERQTNRQGCFRVLYQCNKCI